MGGCGTRRGGPGRDPGRPGPPAHHRGAPPAPPATPPPDIKYRAPPSAPGAPAPGRRLHRALRRVRAHRGEGGLQRVQLKELAYVAFHSLAVDLHRISPARDEWLSIPGQLSAPAGPHNGGTRQRPRQRGPPRWCIAQRHQEDCRVAQDSGLHPRVRTMVAHATTTTARPSTLVHNTAAPGRLPGSAGVRADGPRLPRSHQLHCWPSSSQASLSS